MASPEARRDWVRLSRTPSIGPVTFFQLVTRFGSATAALNALPALAHSAGRKRPLVAPAESEIEREIAAAERFGAKSDQIEVARLWLKDI